MTNEEKLEKLKEFLKENGLVFYEEFRLGKKIGVTADLYIPRHRIVVKIARKTEEDDKFFHATKRYWRPFFIREEESVDFVIEKMYNLIIKIMKIKQKLYDKMIERKKREEIEQKQKQEKK